MVDRRELMRPSRDLVRQGPGSKITCVACAHRCKLADGKRGICLVRERAGDLLLVPWGYTAGVAVDPIEKKPFFHVLPGAAALSFGMLGCNFRCSFCQNWTTSQSLRDPRAATWITRTDPEQLVDIAVRRGCKVVTSTYNEPLITSEWAREIFSRATERGLICGYVSNGYATQELLSYMRPVMRLFKIDLKAMRDSTYRELGGRLQPVLDTIKGAWEMGYWVEVVTLVVPGMNDNPQELREIASFLVSVSPDIPWHVTAFHPDYEMLDASPTPTSTLVKAREIGLESGLKYVYCGNRPGAIPHGEDTLCPNCGEVLVERLGFSAWSNRLFKSSRCPKCGTPIAGVWRLEEDS